MTIRNYTGPCWTPRSLKSHLGMCQIDTLHSVATRGGMIILHMKRGTPKAGHAMIPNTGSIIYEKPQFFLGGCNVSRRTFITCITRRLSSRLIEAKPRFTCHHKCNTNEKLNHHGMDNLAAEGVVRQVVGVTKVRAHADGPLPL